MQTQIQRLDRCCHDGRRHFGAAPAETYRGSELASGLLKRLFDRLPMGVTLRLWDDAPVQGRAPSTADAQEPAFTLVFRNPEAVCSAVLGRDPLRLAEAYFRGDLDIEGDFFAALELKDHLQALQMSVGEQVAVARHRLAPAGAECGSRIRAGRSRPLASDARVKAHSKAEIAMPSIFTTMCRTSSMRYGWTGPWSTRALISRTPEVDLDAAQEAKLDHICRKLPLRPGENFSISAAAGARWSSMPHAATACGRTASL